MSLTNLLGLLVLLAGVGYCMWVIAFRQAPWLRDWDPFRKRSYWSRALFKRWRR